MPSIVIIAAKNYNKGNNKLLLEEAKKAFDKVLFVPINKLTIVHKNGTSKLLYKGINLLDFDACYPRFGSTDYFMGEAVLKVIESSKIYSPVSLKGYQISNHKFYTIQEIAESGLPCVLTSLSASPQSMESIVEEMTFPLVLKLISGFGGRGVMLISNKNELQSILDTVHLFEEYITAQRFLPTGSTDIRCYVFGDDVLSVRRTGAPNDWRANISRGGKAEIIDGNPKMEECAIKVAKLLGFDICAVDFIETDLTKEGFAVIEVNFQPGPFRKFLGNVVPKKMMEFIRAKIEKKK
ncbi:MAG: RimK family alpha-L-glutamate ligase [Candidatus Diapherotrites archaeon]|nr:RimK family alpha-L-glutamate ligase [Candidatus Diapherotrites archaeon]